MNNENRANPFINGIDAIPKDRRRVLGDVTNTYSTNLLAKTAKQHVVSSILAPKSQLYTSAVISAAIQPTSSVHTSFAANNNQSYQNDSDDSLNTSQNSTISEEELQNLSVDFMQHHLVTSNRDAVLREVDKITEPLPGGTDICTETKVKLVTYFQKVFIQNEAMQNALNQLDDIDVTGIDRKTNLQMLISPFFLTCFQYQGGFHS
jgi:hypothetical protein